MTSTTTVSHVHTYRDLKLVQRITNSPRDCDTCHDMTSTTPGVHVIGGMFDNLTRDDLSSMHGILAQQHEALMAQLYDADYHPLLEVGGAEWNAIRVREADTHDTMTAVFAEIQRRDESGDECGDLVRYPLTGVPMVCTACREPVERVAPETPALTGWHHVHASDGIGCPASLRVIKAMVAAGNESVPRG